MNTKPLSYPDTWVAIAIMVVMSDAYFATTNLHKKCLYSVGCFFSSWNLCAVWHFYKENR